MKGETSTAVEAKTPTAPLGAPAASSQDPGEVARRPRAPRSVLWGEWTIAPVTRRSDGAVIGWGAVCGCHVDETSRTRCQKQVTLGTGPNPISEAEARRLVKCWLILGREIERTDPEGRRKHVLGIKIRQAAPDAWTEDVLDGFVA